MIEIESYDLLATAVLLLNRQGKVEYANVSAQELFSLSRKQLADLPGYLLFTDTALEARFLDAVNGRLGVLRQDVSVERFGTAFQASLTIVPLEQQPWAALFEVRRLDQHSAMDRTQQLSKELDAQRELLRNLAHEVKNPLGGLRGAAQLLQDELSVDSLREYTGVIIAEADRLGKLVDRLIAPQGGSLQRSEFNIHEACERVCTLVSAEFSQIEVLRDYDTSVPELVGDRSRLVQALLNVVRNAAQALVEAPATVKPTLILRTRIGRQLVLASQAIKMGVVISVIDNGPGVLPELRDKVFHPLVTGRANGSGLGLSLAQEFMQQHGGIIDFDSRAGHTEFRLILPLGAL